MPEPHNIFISWSGEPSRKVAEALHGWLPMVIQAATPWMSNSDIEKGQRWGNEIAARLSQIDIGIVCLTPDNLNSPWLLFEAGAISKEMQRGRVCTYLVDLRPEDV